MNEDVSPIKTGGFPSSYVSLPEGSSPWCGPTWPFFVVWCDPLPKRKKPLGREGARLDVLPTKPSDPIRLMATRNPAMNHQLRPGKILETRGYLPCELVIAGFLKHPQWWGFCRIARLAVPPTDFVGLCYFGTCWQWDIPSKWVETKLLWHSILKTCLGK